MKKKEEDAGSLKNRSRKANLKLLYLVVLFLTDCCAFSIPVLEKLHPALELACQAGFELADIERKLSEVADISRRMHLHSESRNLLAQKVVLDRRYDRERLLCESNDLLILYDCKQKAMVDWLIRKDTRRTMTHFEEDAQNCLNVWSPVTEEKYQPTCAMLSRNIAILASALRHTLSPCSAISASVLSLCRLSVCVLCSGSAETVSFSW